MLISARTTIALRCPNCGRLVLLSVSRFDFGRKESIGMTCECGEAVLEITKKGKTHFCLQVECIMCEAKHTFTYKSINMWSDEVKTISCENTGMEIGLFGQRDLVKENIKAIDKSVRQMLKDVEYDGYFSNTGIMRRVLEYVNDLNGQGLVSCSCGNNRLEVEVFPDRIELTCPHCQAVGILFAETPRDLNRVCNLGNILLEAGSYKYLDDSKLRKYWPVE